MIELWGIRQCDSVRKMLAVLDLNGLTYRFHDLDVERVESPRLAKWLSILGFKQAMNPASRDWKATAETMRQAARSDASVAMALLEAHPRIFRRPIIEWPDGTITAGLAAAMAHLGELA